MSVAVRFRWPVKQVGERVVRVVVPVEAGGISVKVHIPDTMLLSDRDIDAANDAAFVAVITELAVIR